MIFVHTWRHFQTKEWSCWITINIEVILTELNTIGHLSMHLLHKNWFQLKLLIELQLSYVLHQYMNSRHVANIKVILHFNKVYISPLATLCSSGSCSACVAISSLHRSRHRLNEWTLLRSEAQLLIAASMHWLRKRSARTGRKDKLIDLVYDKMIECWARCYRSISQ